MAQDAFKRLAAERALTYVEPGMTLGLGTGSTAAVFAELLAAKVKAGLDVVCVPTSKATEAFARKLGLKLATLDECIDIDLAVDGADEATEEGGLIKGGGGALLREKMVASAASRFIVIVDHTKCVEQLGKFPLPVEIVTFAPQATAAMIEEIASAIGCFGDIELRQGADGKPFVTDNGNYILDCHFEQIDEPEALDMMLAQVPGVVEHGLFLEMAERVIVAGPDGVEEFEAADLGDLVDDTDEADPKGFDFNEILKKFKK